MGALYQRELAEMWLLKPALILDNISTLRILPYILSSWNAFYFIAGKDAADRGDFI